MHTVNHEPSMVINPAESLRPSHSGRGGGAARSILLGTTMSLFATLGSSQTPAAAIGTTSVERWPEGKKAAFMMLFDDACPTHVSNVVPELTRRGMTGTFYIIPAKGEYKARRSFWEEEAPTFPGIVYGNHSYSHKAFESEEHAEKEMLQANELILRLFPGKTPRLVSYASPGGVKHAISGEQIKELAARNHLIVRPTFQGHGAAVHYKTAESVLKDIDKAAAGGGDAAYVIFHGVGGDWISFPLDQFHALLDGLEERRDSVWIADPIAIHKYETERATAKVLVAAFDTARLQLDLRCETDPALYDQPLTLVTQVPKSWKKCRVTQGDQTVIVPAVDGMVRYEARPGAGPIYVEPVPGA